MDKSLQTIRSGGAEVVGLFERVMSNKKLCAFMKGHAAGMRRVQEELGRSSAGEVLELQKSGRLEPSDHDYGNLLDPKDSAKGDLRIPRETNAAADLVKFLSQTTARASSHTEMSQNPWRGGNFNTAPMTFRHQTSSRPNGHNQVRRAYTWTNSYQNGMLCASNISFKSARKSSLQLKMLSSCSEFQDPKKSVSGQEEETSVGGQEGETTAQPAHQKISQKASLPKKALRYNVERLIMGLFSDSKTRMYKISHTASTTGLPVARSLLPSSARKDYRRVRKQQRRWLSR